MFSEYKIIKRTGLIVQYQHNEQLRKSIRSIAALSMLPENMVANSFNILRQNSPAAAAPIFEYFENTYISRGQQDPLFPIPSWNHHATVLADQCRTNNAIEGYHRALKSRFANPKPLLSRLIMVLKDEERFMHDRLHLYEMDPTRGISTRPRSPTYIRNDAAIKALVERFDGIQNPTNEQLLVHLGAIQYRMARNDFDRWDD